MTFNLEINKPEPLKLVVYVFVVQTIKLLVV